MDSANDQIVVGLELLGRGLDDPLEGDLFHAAKIDGAIPAEAGRAGQFGFDEGMTTGAGLAGAGEFGGGAAEGDNDRRAHGCGQMSRAGIVGDE